MSSKTIDETGEGHRFQLRLLDQMLAADALRRTDPEAYQAKMEAELPTNSCCFCRETFRGYGNKPWPVLDTGTACNVCNHSIVMTARLQAMRR